MAALALPVLEAIALRVLAAVGIGVAGGVAVEETQKRRKETDKAGDVPIARSDTKTGEKCKECSPDHGKEYRRSTAGWKPWTIEYQARIGGMPYGPGYIMEWEFKTVKFDGFVSGQCLLKEAKARYDQFFDEWGDFAYPFQKKIFEDMTDEAESQNSVAIPKPPVRLQWNFMEPVSYKYMLDKLMKATPQIEVLYTP